MMNDQLDEIIDDVAHEPIAGEPHDAGVFRRRVLARVEGASQPPRTRRILWILSPVGAAAAIAIALTLLRPSVPTPPADRARPATSPQPAPQPHRATTVESSPNTTENPTGPAAVNSTRRARASRSDEPNANTPDGEALLDALAPAALTVDPITVGAISVPRLSAAEPITIDQLETIAPIAVTPIGIDDPQRRQE